MNSFSNFRPSTNIFSPRTWQYNECNEKITWNDKYIIINDVLACLARASLEEVNGFKVILSTLKKHIKCYGNVIDPKFKTDLFVEYANKCSSIRNDIDLENIIILFKRRYFCGRSYINTTSIDILSSEVENFIKNHERGNNKNTEITLTDKRIISGQILLHLSNMEVKESTSFAVILTRLKESYLKQKKLPNNNLFAVELEEFEKLYKSECSEISGKIEFAKIISLFKRRKFYGNEYLITAIVIRLKKNLKNNINRRCGNLDINQLKSGMHKRFDTEHGFIFVTTKKGISDLVREVLVGKYIENKDLGMKKYLSLQKPLKLKRLPNPSLIKKYAIQDLIDNRESFLDAKQQHWLRNIVQATASVDRSKIKVAIVPDYDKNATDLFTFIQNEFKKSPKCRDREKITKLLECMMDISCQFYFDQFIHRDMHSKNIIVSKEDTLKIIDVGNCKFDTEVTQDNKLDDINYLFAKRAPGEFETWVRNSWRSPDDQKQKKHYPIHLLLEA